MAEAAYVATLPRVPAARAEPLLEVADLKTWFFTRDGVVHAVDGVSFHVFPGVFLSITVLAINLLGDGLRDALDPRLARRM